jgi:hypothetical protein
MSFSVVHFHSSGICYRCAFVVATGIKADTDQLEMVGNIFHIVGFLGFHSSVRFKVFDFGSAALGTDKSVLCVASHSIGNIASGWARQ